MNSLLILLLLVPLVVYIVTVEKWRVAWKGAKEGANEAEEADFTAKKAKLSVIIALHNEENNVKKLAENLPKCETIFVCDHCTDRTFERLKELTSGNENVKVVENNLSRGKKFAQRVGAEIAREDFLLFTDADCRIGNDWAKSIANFLAKTNADLVIAPVVMKGENYLQHLFEIEFLSLQMSSAGSALMWEAIMCNGANLAVKKEIYLHHDAKTEYVSGDDMFLLGEVKRIGGKISYLKSREAIIKTSTPENLHDFFRQRTRWLRKCTGYNDRDVKICAQKVFWANIALLVLPFVSVEIFVVAFLMKFVIDYRLLRSGRDFFGVRVDMISTITVAIFYPLMMVAVAVLSVFRSKREW